MFRAFDLKSLSSSTLSSYEAQGKILLEEQRYRAAKELDDYFNSDGELEAEDIFEDWFPNVEADVFLSHSHADKDDVYALAAFLKHEMGLTAFVDSAVWGYADDLLKRFDKKFCLSHDGITYDYDKRNITTTHVHLMLNMSLLSMMDKTEAIFFYNTPNSVSLKDSVHAGGTYSPWIFSEISMTRMLRAKKKSEHRVSIAKSHTILEARDAMPKIRYPLRLGHLREIDQKGFDSWADSVSNSGARGTGALDELYRITDAE